MMKIRYLRAFISALTFCLLLIGASNQDSFGQGKGKGGGNPHGGPPGQEKHGGEGGGQPQGRGNGGWQQQRQQPQPQPQQIVRQQQRQQPPQQVFRQQENRMPPGQARKQERVYQQPAPQQVWRQQAPQQVWRQQQQQQAYRMPPGQAKKQQQQAYDPAPIYQDRGQGNGRGRWQRQNDAPPWSSGWVPPGQIRSAEVHERNAIRKADKEAARAYGRQYNQPYYAPYVTAPNYGYDRSYRYDQGYGYSQPSYYSSPYYQTYQYYTPEYVPPYRYSGGGYLNYSPMYVPNTYIYEPYTAYATNPDYYGYSSPYYGYNNGGSNWKSMLVRTLIGFVLGNESNGNYGLQPYDPYYGYGQSYSSYGTSYNDYYPTSYSRGMTYVQPMYDYSGYDVPLVNLMPMQDLFGPSYGGYSSDTLRQVLAQGYEQGYQAGWYARDNQLRDAYLVNGYRAEDDYYDPYSYSIGENRRCFSEGYSIGYQDAFNGRQGYISQHSGGTDLLSLLLSNVIGTA